MGLFRKKEKLPKNPTVSPPKSLEEIVTERVLTAEGWQRRTLAKAPETSKKSIHK